MYGFGDGAGESDEGKSCRVETMTQPDWQD